MKLNWILITLLLGMVFMACGDDTDQLLEDDMIIAEYLAANGLTAESTATGLHYIIIDEGDGEHPTLGSNVTVRYTGYFTDGTVFDSSGDETVTFPLGGVILGWQEGIPFLGRGGSGTLLIPSHLGYGSRGQGSIPGNTVLLFDVDLVDF